MVHSGWVGNISPTMAVCSVAVCSVIVARIYLCLPKGSKQARESKKSLPLGGKGERVKTMVYFGSGGHTTEMIRLIQGLAPSKYSPMIFAIGHTDITSIDKVRGSNIGALEKRAKWLRIFRNREVKQSWVTTIFTSIWSMVQAFYVMYRTRPQLLICNGPGTCVSLCYSAFALNILGLSSTRIVFVESFCRTEGLSLTGKLLLYISDQFIVQWPQLVNMNPDRISYLGVIC